MVKKCSLSLLLMGIVFFVSPGIFHHDNVSADSSDVEYVPGRLVIKFSRQFGDTNRVIPWSENGIIRFTRTVVARESVTVFGRVSGKFADGDTVGSVEAHACATVEVAKK